MPMTEERKAEIALLVCKRVMFIDCLRREEGDAELALANCEKAMLESIKENGPMTETDYANFIENTQKATGISLDEAIAFTDILHQHAVEKIKGEKPKVYVGAPCPTCSSGLLQYEHYGFGYCSACKGSFQLD